MEEGDVDSARLENAEAGDISRDRLEYTDIGDPNISGITSSSFISDKSRVLEEWEGMRG